MGGTQFHNEIASGAVISGNVVLAGTVTGGVHNYHFTEPGRSAPYEVPEISPEQAREFFETACRLEMDWADEVPFPEIRELLYAAARAGHADAMARFGLFIEGRLHAALTGADIDPTALDVEAAMRWYTRAAHLGSPIGALYLGQVHEDHYGNPGEALKWYSKAADAGLAAARSRRDGLRERLELGLGNLAGRKEFGRRAPSERKPMPRKSDFDRWVEDDWNGSEPMAIAYCLGELSETSGGPHGEWGVLADQEQIALLKHFTALHPTSVTLPAVAFEYYQNIGKGNLREFAGKLVTGRVPKPEDLAPVWALQKREGRVSTLRFSYTITLAVQDYDWLTALLAGFADQPRADLTLREYALRLTLITRELHHRRDSAIPTADNTEDRWEFFPIFTPEQLQDVLAHADHYAADPATPQDLRGLWTRIAAALNAAPAHPFP